jgi:hypothetical protein
LGVEDEIPWEVLQLSFVLFSHFLNINFYTRLQSRKKIDIIKEKYRRKHVRKNLILNYGDDVHSLFPKDFLGFISNFIFDSLYVLKKLLKIYLIL